VSEDEQHRENPPDSGCKGQADRDALIHELRVHQTELEAQNAELREAHAEIARLHRRYADLYEFAPVGYLTLDQHGRISEANISATILLGKERSRLSGAGLERFIAFDYRDALHRALSRATETSDTQHAELRLMEPESGRPSAWVRADIEPANARHASQEGSGDESHAWWVTLTNITEQKRAQEAAERLAEEKQLLLREVQHRVKNDLGLVESFLNLQADESAEPSVAAALNKARERIDVLRTVYTSLHQGHALNQVALQDVVAAVVRAAGGSAPGHVAVHTDVAELTLPSRIASSVGLIANELLTNAVKYATTGDDPLRVDLTVREERAAGPLRHLSIVMRDTGPGLPAHVLDNPTGAGFRLTLVHALTQQHDGELRLENCADTGGARISAGVRWEPASS
jgi:PAS domain S-box-containing protein